MKKIMIRSAALSVLSICITAYGYSNPIEGGSTEIVSDHWNVAVPWLLLGGNSSSNMLYVADGGQVDNDIGIIGNNASSMENSAFVSGSNAVWNNALELSVGNQGSDNTLGIFGGGQVSTADAYIGKASSNNFAAISGAGSELTAGTLHVGHTGAGNTMAIFDGGTVTSEDTSLGHWIGSDGNTGMVMGTNALWNNSGTLNVGEHGSDNTLLIAEEGTVQSPVVNLGVHSYSTNNSITVFGENARLDAAELNIGGTAATVGGMGNRVSVYNGGSVATTNLTIYDGNNLDLNDGGTLAVDNDFDASLAGFNFNSGGTLEVGGELTGMDSTIEDQRTLILKGSDAVWSNSYRLSLGHEGSGNTLEISDGGQVYSGHSIIGDYNQSSNNVLISDNGSRWVNAGDLSVGVMGSGNSMVVSNGGSVENANGYIGKSALIPTTFNEQAAPLPHSSADNNSVTITGAGSVWANTGDVVVGNYGSDNSLNIMDGGLVENADGVIGHGEVASGNRAVVSGGTWSNSGSLVVGNYGSGNMLEIKDGGLVQSMSGHIGAEEGADGNSAFITGTGSRWISEGDFFVGTRGSNNAMTIADGGAVRSGRSYIGWVENANGNQVVVTDAGSRWDAGWLDVGSHGFGNTLIITNGGMVASERASVGRYGDGNTAIVTGADSVWTNNDFLIVGDGGSDNALHILDGATVQSAFVGITSPGLNQNLPGGSNNTVRVSGPGSTLIVAGETPYGATADGILDMWNGLLRIENGGAVHSAVAGIGGKVIVDGSGSVWSNSSTASIVDLTVSDGGAAFAGSAETGGEITIEGAGSEWVVSNSLSLASSTTVRDEGQINAGTATIDRGGMTTVTGGGSALEVGNALTIGESYGGNTLLIENGGTVASAGGNIGYGETSSSNAVVVTGEGSVWNALEEPSYLYHNPNSEYRDGAVYTGPDGLNVGYEGRGNRLTISDGGRVDSSAGSIGHGEWSVNNTVLVTGDGSIWENRGALNVGHNGSENTLRIEDGGVVASLPGVTLGYGEHANENQLIVSGAGSMLKGSFTTPPFDFSDPIIQPPQTNFPPIYISHDDSSLGATLVGGEGLEIGNAGLHNTLTVHDGSQDPVLEIYSTNNTVLLANGGSSLANSNGLEISGGTFIGDPVINPGGTISNQPPDRTIIIGYLGALTVGRSGTGNAMIIEDGAKAYSQVGVIGQEATASNNMVSITGQNSEWRTDSDLSLGGRMVHYVYWAGDFNQQSEISWVDGGRGNSLYVGEGGTVNVGRDLQNRNDSSINVDPGAAINVASNYYQDAMSSLRFGVETNAAGAPLNALVTVGGTAEFEKGARIEYASNVGQLQFDTFYTNKIIAADKLIVAGIENPDSLDLEMLDASGTLVDVIFWENEQDIYGLVGRKYLADSAGFTSHSMMASLSKEIDDMSLMGDAKANGMINRLNTMSGSQQAAQLEQQYRRGAPAYQHARSMTEGMNEIKKHTATKNQTRPSQPVGAEGPYRADQELQGWIKPYGLWADHAATDGFSGYDQSVYGTVVGLDLPLETALLGVAGGYGHSTLSQDDGDQSTAETGYGVVYINWGADDWFCDVNMGFGRSRIEQESGSEFNNSAAYDASNFAVQFGGGKEIQINRCWAFTPKASALWTYYYQQAYTETSSQGVERIVDAYERNSLLSRLGAAVSWKKEFKTMVLKPEARLYWLHEFNDDVDQINYELQNGLGGEYHFLMAAPESDVLEAGLGISWILNDDLQFVLDVDGRFGEDYSAYALSGRAVIEF